MNRRALVAAATLAAVPLPTLAAPSQADILRQLIDEVIAAGDMANLDNLVASNVVIAELGVQDRDGFQQASVDGYTARSTEYRSASFNILSVAEADAYAHALVRFEGERQNGRKEARHIFYVARFTDGLVSQLYLS